MNIEDLHGNQRDHIVDLQSHERIPGRKYLKMFNINSSCRKLVSTFLSTGETATNGSVLFDNT
jgi:hypothetical protein